MTHVRLEQVSLAFGQGADRMPALERVSLSLGRNEVVVVLGPSGCGKTTLLRLVAGLLAPDEGRVSVDDRPPRPGEDAAMVFQSFRLIPWKSARENVAFALPHLPRAEARARADAYLDLVGLSRFAKSWPAQLSGGMRQRLALARALAAEPGILLMDEPFASLDAQSRELMQIELMRLMERRPATVLFVTHSVDEALIMADRILLMSPRPGRVVEEVEVPFPRPRWEGDIRALPLYAELRRHLWDRLRDMVLNDPGSDFHGRR
nr:ABC transporter ATP-binding protein [Cereibacter sediminicola]